MKMAVVGFGKQPGAFQSTRAVRSRCATGCSTHRRAAGTGRLLGGIASIESTVGDVVRVEGSPPTTSAAGAEHELTEYARTLVPALPFDEIDVLIVELGGKDISGTTMDPNVTGRFWVPGLDDPQKPASTRSCCSTSPT
jgi:hypothetical protein